MVTVAFPDGIMASAGALFLAGNAMVRAGLPVSSVISRYQASGAAFPYRSTACTLRTDPGGKETCQVPFTESVRKREDPDRRFVHPQVNGTGDRLTGTSVPGG